MFPRVFKQCTTKVIEELNTKKSTLYVTVIVNLLCVQLYDRPVGKGGKVLLNLKLVPYTFYYK